MLWPPSASIHWRNSFRTFFLAGSWILEGISNQVKLEIGYASFPGAFVIDTRKSGGMAFAAPAAAAVTLARSAFMKAPELLRTLPYPILFWTAYTSST